MVIGDLYQATNLQTSQQTRAVDRLASLRPLLLRLPALAKSQTAAAGASLTPPIPTVSTPLHCIGGGPLRSGCVPALRATCPARRTQTEAGFIAESGVKIGVMPLDAPKLPVSGRFPPPVPILLAGR